MSRSGYSDEVDDQWALIRWRGAVKQSLRGERGQAFMREALAAFDSMPIKELARDSLRTEEGAYCTLGAVGAARGMNLDALDPYDIEAVAAEFGISNAMAREIVYINDEACWHDETPAQRWHRMRGWLARWTTPTHAEARSGNGGEG